MSGLYSIFSSMRLSVLLAASSVICVSLVTLLLPILLGKWVGYTQDASHIWIWISCYVISFAAVSSFRVYAFSILAQKVGMSLRRGILENIFSKQSADANDDYFSSQVDVRLVESVIEQIASQFLRNIFLIVGGILIMLWTSPKLTGVVFLVLPICLMPIFLSLRYYRQVTAQLKSIDERRESLISSLMSYAIEVWYYSRSSWGLAKADSDLTNWLQVSNKKLRLRVLITFLTVFFILMALASVIYFATGFNFSQQDISSGDLTMFALASLLVGLSATGMGELLHQISQARAALEKLLGPGSLDIDADKSAYEKIAFSAICLQGVSFRYSAAEKNILSDLNLSIKRGEKVAFVGASGCGKSTLLKLILGLEKLSAGTISLGDDISVDQLAQWRAHFAFSLGNKPILKSSVRDNILLGAPEDEQIATVISAYGLNDWYDEQGGLSAQMQTASAGQLQRIQGLSALLQNKPILVLDEITSHCDLKTQMLVHDYLMGIDTTVLVATHQVDLMKKCDRVLFFRPNGQVILSNHQQLSQKDKDYQLLLAESQQE